MQTWQDQMVQLAQKKNPSEATNILKEQFTKGNTANSANLQVLLESCIYNGDLYSTREVMQIMVKSGQEIPKIVFREGLDSLLRDKQDENVIAIAEKYLLSPNLTLDDKLVTSLIEKIDQQKSLLQILEIILKIVKQKQPNEYFWRDIIQSFVRKNQIEIASQIIIQAPLHKINVFWDDFLFECVNQNNLQLGINTIITSEKIAGCKLEAQWDYLVKAITRCGKVQIEQINNLLTIIFQNNIQIQGLKQIFYILSEQNQEELILNYLIVYKPVQCLDSLIIQNLFENLIKKKKYIHGYQLYKLVIDQELGENIWEGIQNNSTCLKEFIYFLLTKANIKFKEQPKPKFQQSNQMVQTQNEEQSSQENQKEEEKQVFQTDKIIIVEEQRETEYEGYDLV